MGLLSLRKYIQGVEDSCIFVEPWCCACDREHQVKEARKHLEFLQRGASIDVAGELQELHSLWDKAIQARKDARKAEDKLFDADEESELSALRDTCHKCRNVAQLADRTLQKRIAR